jgi:hypothetical protein
MTRGRVRRRATDVGATLGVAITVALVAPSAVLGHALNPTYTSRLPLAVYLTGAAITVALSFAFVLARDVRARPATATGPAHLPPRVLRLVLRAIGLVAWVWIVVQGILGGSSAGSVAPLFLWVYGWVGLALVSAFAGPAWHFIDPFSTFHDIGAWALRRLGVSSWTPAAYPARLGRWPACVGFAGFVWLELVDAGGGPATLFIVLVGYTAFTLAMMAQFGRDTWRSNAEVFTVWFRLLGRLAAYALADEDGQVRRRPFAAGLLEPGWSRADAALAALGVGSILFDGLSQTQFFFDRFGAPGIAGETLLLAAWLGLLVAAAMFLTRYVGIEATGAGLLPIAVGYLIAHYLTYLLIDGQGILVAISDPFQRGWDLFGTAFHEPTGAWLPPGLVWTVQLAAVVGGHMLGAWAGHVNAAMHAPPGVNVRSLTRREIPLAVVMVSLTTLTLWSLGQAIIVAPPETPAASLAVPAVGLRGDGDLARHPLLERTDV